VPGYPLLKFFEKIEQSGYPISISRLNIRKRGGEHDSFDVELGVSAFERSEAPAAAATGTATGAGTAAPPSSAEPK
jgi:general secretion pathway protein M